MNNSSYNFSRLCWQSGFISYTPGQHSLDKDALMVYLHVTRRTLNRWISGEPACPRALKLLKQRLAQLNTGWDGFYYDRQNKLGHADWRLTYTPDQVRQLPELMRHAASAQSDIAMYKRKFDEVINIEAAQAQREALLGIAESINAIANNTAFYGFMKKLASS